MPYRTMIGVHLVLIEGAGCCWGCAAVPPTPTRRGTRRRPSRVHTLHDLDADDGAGRLQLFFRPARYTGEITNTEPEKCHQLRWWPLDALPEPVVGYTVQALGAIAAGAALSVRGFSA